MDPSNRSEAIRRTILEMVGLGHTAEDIRARVGGDADEHDLRYADSLVKVRDEVRAEKLKTEVKPAPAGV